MFTKLCWLVLFTGLLLYIADTSFVLNIQHGVWETHIAHACLFAYCFKAGCFFPLGEYLKVGVLLNRVFSPVVSKNLLFQGYCSGNSHSAAFWEVCGMKRCRISSPRSLKAARKLEAPLQHVTVRNVSFKSSPMFKGSLSHVGMFRNDYCQICFTLLTFIIKHIN